MGILLTYDVTDERSFNSKLLLPYLRQSAVRGTKLTIWNIFYFY